MSAPPSPARRTAVMCVAEVLSMTAASAYPALLPRLLQEWSLSNSGAGFVSGSFFVGYMVAVPVLTSLTDRVDARRVYFLATLLSAAGAAGFGLLARGQFTAALFQAIAGAGLAGTYMPGLRILSDHLDPRRHSRYIAFYTSTFGLGSSASILLAATLSNEVGWRVAFGVLALGPIAAGILLLSALPGNVPRAMPAGARPPLLDVRGVLANHSARSYIIGYAAHCFELFGLRSWMVAFFVFTASLQGGSHLLSAASAAAAINLLGPLASIFGNELAARFGRRRFISRVAIASALASAVIGFTARLPWIVSFAAMIVYFLLIMGDSAAVTAGLVGAAERGRRGATMALHAFLGFGAGSVAPLVFGVVLDAAGGGARTLAWGLAFASLGVGGAVGPIAFALYERRARQRHSERIESRKPRAAAGPG